VRSFKSKDSREAASNEAQLETADMQKASQPRLRYPHRATAARFRVLLDEVTRGDVAAIFAKTRNQRKSRQDRREMVQLLLMILGAIVAAIVGLYAGVTSSHYHEHSH
jgi:hypothetical protein